MVSPTQGIRPRDQPISLTCQRILAVRWWRDVHENRGGGNGHGLGARGNDGGHLTVEPKVSQANLTT